MTVAKKHPGFTLVELLVVIVVIAILAAISVVTYSGVQERAENARIAAAIDSYYKVFEATAATEGTYPDLGSGCLGIPSDYPANDQFLEGACVMSSPTTGTTLSPNLQEALSSNVSSLPSVKLPPVTVDFGYGMIYSYRGIWVSSHPTNFEFQYWLKGDKSCPKGVATYFASSDATRCNVYWGAFS